MRKKIVMQHESLIQDAREAREKAFCPYSEYPVGAAVETDDGVFTGANIEVSGRSTSIHAEMLAFFQAVYNEAEEFRKMAVSPKNQSGEAICGLCQHTVAQFTDELLIIEDCGEEDPETYQLSELIGPAYSPSTRH